MATSGGKVLAEHDGAFIVIEGLDGAGTTTQARLLYESLEKRCVPCHLTREPSDGPIGRLLREFLAKEHGESDPSALALLFTADRMDHLNREIVPALQDGKIVICDRYYHSTLAYQGMDGNEFWVRRLNERAYTPHCTFFLKVDADVAAKRRAAEEDRTEELFDKTEFQEKLEKSYLSVVESCKAGEERIELIDGHLQIDVIAYHIRTTTLELYK